jgi:hypothetical protein
VSLENVLLDVRELGKGMDLIRRECSLHDHSVLKGFLQTSDTQLDKLQKDAKTAEVNLTHPIKTADTMVQYWCEDEVVGWCKGFPVVKEKRTKMQRGGYSCSLIKELDMK